MYIRQYSFQEAPTFIRPHSLELYVGALEYPICVQLELKMKRRVTNAFLCLSEAVRNRLGTSDRLRNIMIRRIHACICLSMGRFEDA